MDQKSFLKKAFEQGVSGDLPKLLSIFRTEAGVLDFCLRPVFESVEMTDEEKDSLLEIITQSLKEMFAALRRQKDGGDILDQIL